MTFQPNSSQGNTYIPAYRNYQLEEEELKLALNRDYTTLANAVNLKTNGVFETVETQTGGQFFGTASDQRKKRFAFRKCFVVSAIAAGASLSIPIGVEGITDFTAIYGAVITNNADKRPLPYASVTANANIELRVDNATNSIVITLGAVSPNVTSGIVVIEYLKQ